ncbi:MAG: hypothetical protein U0Y08_08625 [Bacteroidia bacterium]
MNSIQRYIPVILIVLIESCTSGKINSNPEFQINILDSTNQLVWFQSFIHQLPVVNAISQPGDFEFKMFEETHVLDERRMFCITKKDSTWMAFEYQFYISKVIEDDKSSVPYIDSATIYILKPKIPIEHIIDSIMNSGALTLPNQKSIKDFEDPIFDGTIYSFEIRTKDQYRFYSYHCPHEFDQPENKKVTELILFLDRNFNFQNFKVLHD